MTTQATSPYLNQPTRSLAEVIRQRESNMRQRPTIVKAYTRRYTDTGQIVARVEWLDGSVTTGDPASVHMQQLFKRAQREHLIGEHEEF